MSKQKFYYYIGIQTVDGLMLVTSIDNESRMAHWDLDKKPLAMSQSIAVDVAEGLCLNLIVAVVIKSFFELEGQFIQK